MLDNTKYVNLLRSKSIRPSAMRVAVLKFVCEHKIHPTAEDVYQALIGDYPTLSRTTVYNTLHLFGQEKILNTVNIEDEQLRYDGELKPHIHFKCSKCGKIFDIMENGVSDYFNNCASFLPKDFLAAHTEISVWGKCPGCSKE